MSLDLVFTVLWGIGWFSTLALAAAGTFANWQHLNEGDDSDGFHVLMLALPAAALLIVLWPLVLAVMVGWFVYPFIARMTAEREIAAVRGR
jgi:hypothetical protein